MHIPSLYIALTLSVRPHHLHPSLFQSFKSIFPCPVYPPLTPCLLLPLFFRSFYIIFPCPPRSLYPSLTVCLLLPLFFFSFLLYYFPVSSSICLNLSVFLSFCLSLSPYVSTRCPSVFRLDQACETTVQLLLLYGATLV